METPAIGDIWEYEGWGKEFHNFLIVNVLQVTERYTDCQAIYLEYGEVRLISITAFGGCGWKKVA